MSLCCFTVFGKDKDGTCCISLHFIIVINIGFDVFANIDVILPSSQGLVGLGPHAKHHTHGSDTWSELLCHASSIFPSILFFFFSQQVCSASLPTKDCFSLTNLKFTIFYYYFACTIHMLDSLCTGYFCMDKKCRGMEMWFNVTSNCMCHTQPGLRPQTAAICMK